MYERILVPLDGSELAEVALPYAEELAGRLGSEITILSVLLSGNQSAGDQYHYLNRFYIEKMAETIRKAAERYLEEPRGKSISVDSKIFIGHPAEEIVDYADKADVDLIIMATHGRSGIRRWALGSVAHKVVSGTTCPVALIRAKGAHPDVREKGIWSKALLPLDGSEESEAVIPYVEELGSRLKAEIVLLQVIEPTYYVYAGGGTGGGTVRIPYTENEMKELRASAEDYLKKVANELKGKDIVAKSEVRIGTPAEEIVKLADEMYAGVVAMSTHGRSGISRWAFGSVADRVLNGGNTPLLLVRTAGASTE